MSVEFLYHRLVRAHSGVRQNIPEHPSQFGFKGIISVHVVHGHLQRQVLLLVVQIKHWDAIFAAGKQIQCQLLQNFKENSRDVSVN